MCFVMCVLPFTAFSCYYCSMKFYTENITGILKRPGYHLTALLLAFLFGGSMYFADAATATATTTATATANGNGTGGGIVLPAAGGVLFYLVVMLAVIPALVLIPVKVRPFGSVGHADRRRGFLFYFAVFFIFWLPFLIIKYPGAVQPDTWEMILFYSNGIMNDKQSVLYSLILNWFVTAGQRIGSADIGLFSFLFVQHVCCCLCFAYAARFIDRLGAGPAVRYAVTGITLLNPYVIGYVGVALKDVPFASFSLLLTVLLAEYHQDHGKFNGSFRHNAMLAGTVIILCFLRNNGIYVTALTALVFLPSVVLRRTNVRIFLKIAGSAVVFVILNAVIFKAGHVIVQPNGYKEALSIPFQQTARYVRDYGDDMTPDEREVIDRNLVIDTLASRYDPRISDPVKDHYTGTRPELAGYIGVWGKLFLRHPLCCISATWDQNRSLMLPDESMTNYSFYKDYSVSYELNNCYVGGGEILDSYFTSPAGLSGAKDIVIQVCRDMLGVPVISTPWNIACCTILLLLITAVSLLDGRKDELYYLTPLLATLLITIAGPVIYGHPRYMFPVILALPFVTVYGWYHRERRSVPRK